MPETTSYLVLGLVVAFGILGAFIASVVLRYRNAQRDIEVLEQLAEEERH